VPFVARISAALRRTPARPAIAQGIRAGVVTVAPLIVGALSGNAVGYSWVALGAFEGSLADNGGPYRIRAAAMAAVALGGTVAVIIGSVASRWPLVAVPLAFAAAFVSGMVRVYGSAGATVGVVNLVMTLLALGTPIVGMALVEQRAAYFFGGAAVSAVAALLLWPFQPNNPARHAVAECFDRLAALVDVLTSLPGAADHGSDAWHTRPRAPNAAVREALEEARRQVVAVRLTRDGEMRRGEQLLALLVVAERLYGLLYPLPDLIDNSGLAEPGTAADALRAVLGALAGRLTRVAVMVRPPGPARVVRTLAWVAPVATGAPGTAETFGVASQPSMASVALTMRRIDDECAIAEPVASALQRGAPMPDLTRSVLEAARALAPRPPGMIKTLLEPLRDNWGFQSISFQHAIRLAVGVGAAQAVVMATGLPRGYWLTVTTGIILQPYAGATVEKAIQRVAGTVAGVLIAALITFVLHGPLALTLILFPLTVLTFALRPVNYGYFVLFLTPIFVLLAEGLRHNDPHLAAYRVLNTVLGGMMATICGALLFPAWEREGVAGELAKAVEGECDYLRVVAGESATPEPVAQRAMGLANANAEAAVQRLAGEGPRSAAVFIAGSTLVAVLRRFGGALAAIGAARELTPDAVPDADVAALGMRAKAVLADLAVSLRTGRSPAAIGLWPNVDKDRLPLAPLLVRQVEVLHAAVTRFVAARPAVARGAVAQPAIKAS
jgi:uncharacterized membrane protein YccC